jgi:hypothetical protein
MVHLQAFTNDTHKGLAISDYKTKLQNKDVTGVELDKRCQHLLLCRKTPW